MLKYIMFDTGEFVVLPEHVSHSSVRLMDRKPVSAGFFRLDLIVDGDSIRLEVKVRGESESLHLESREDDARVIEYFLRSIDVSINNKLGLITKDDVISRISEARNVELNDIQTVARILSKYLN